MEKAALDVAVDAACSDCLSPISPWVTVDREIHLAMLASPKSKQVASGEWMIEFSADEMRTVVASLNSDSSETSLRQQSALLMHALRADSECAPSTHGEAAAMGEPWPTA